MHVRLFLKQWGLLLAFFVAVAAVMLGFRAWSDHQANEPIAPQYREFIDKLYARSPMAKKYLDGYFAHFKRTSVASKHFEHVCGAMYKLAEQDTVTVNVADMSETLLQGCESIAGRVTIGLPTN